MILAGKYLYKQYKKKKQSKKDAAAATNNTNTAEQPNNNNNRQERGRDPSQRQSPLPPTAPPLGPPPSYEQHRPAVRRENSAPSLASRQGANVETGRM